MKVLLTLLHFQVPDRMCVKHVTEVSGRKINSPGIYEFIQVKYNLSYILGFRYNTRNLILLKLDVGIPLNCSYTVRTRISYVLDCHFYYLHFLFWNLLIT